MSGVSEQASCSVLTARFLAVLTHCGMGTLFGRQNDVALKSHISNVVFFLISTPDAFGIRIESLPFFYVIFHLFH